MFYKIVSIPLLPVFLYQGKKVKKTIPKLPEALGERVGNGKILKTVLILGDSAAAGVGVDIQKNALSGQIFKNLGENFNFSWELIAKSGVTTKESINYLKELEYKQYDIVVVSLGVNDVLSTLDASKWANHVVELINLLKKKFNSKLILFTNLPPMGSFSALPQPLRWYLGSRANEFNMKLNKMFKNTNGVYNFNIKFGNSSEFLAIDGFHPSKKGYEVWGKIVAELIKSKSFL